MNETTARNDTRSSQRTAHPLTPREVGVMEHVCSGTSIAKIAALLGIAEGTVHTHLKAIRRKLHLRHRSRATLIAAYMNHCGPGEP